MKSEGTTLKNQKGIIMFGKNKNKDVSKTINDQEYDNLWRDCFSGQKLIEDIIREYKIKEIKIKLFPENTDDYNIALKEYQEIKTKIITAKSAYRKQLNTVKEYYDNHYNNLTYTKTWLPTQWATPDEVIERTIERVFK